MMLMPEEQAHASATFTEQRRLSVFNFAARPELDIPREQGARPEYVCMYTRDRDAAVNTQPSFHNDCNHGVHLECPRCLPILMGRSMAAHESEASFACFLTRCAA